MRLYPPWAGAASIAGGRVTPRRPLYDAPLSAAATFPAARRTVAELVVLNPHPNPSGPRGRRGEPRSALVRGAR